MNASALIVAAGRGHRMSGHLPKQYLQLGGQSILRHTVEAFLGCSALRRLVTVIHPDDRALYAEALAGVEDQRVMAPVFGGDSRSASVRNGLQALADDPPDKVLIHDAARPFCDLEVIEDVLTALDHTDGAFAAVPVVDALWRAADGQAQSSVSRDGMWRAQTPQGFQFAAILDAHRAATGEATDDVAVARAAGLTVQIVEGREANFKITTPEDLTRAELWLAQRG